MLLAKINHGWRWIGTAFSFFVFGLGGILLPLLVMPALYLLPGDQLCRERRAQRVIHHSFRFYIGMMRFLGVLTYEVNNIEKLKGAKLILANHPSLIDVIFLISIVPNANCVVKGRLARNPFTRGPIKAAGYIINDEAADVITAARQVFAKGHALIVFPEGTRTSPGQLPQLKRGAANVAVRADADITPVLIECSPTTLTKSNRWYQVPSKRVHFLIDIKDRIDVERYLKDANPSKSARQLTRDLSDFFHKELGLNE
ncbi:lysophospholipid acyltransferase family protein [Marinobacterium arenosum]|uniref:lysophospholipid acyltransferase family protein n=1 Tax=Marinobacterium arenosum TaxID=2862496 RepID=UPI001C96176A|nr:lysophospholipid acyltransferase family protein [Marinobacterium arenosum]MBY4676108.1 1-acyl-sn-glycerol-3-phosphate acyltransferase [Marinobacterium arenosum]